MKISKTITINDKLAISRQHYFDIADTLVSLFKKNHDIEIFKRFIWRAALDFHFQDRWVNHIDKPAYSHLFLIDLLSVTKRMVSYYQSPFLLHKDMKESNSYRKNVSPTELIP